MKKTFAFVLAACIPLATASLPSDLSDVGFFSDEQLDAQFDIPGYPLWLAHVLARIGHADAQAELTADPCTAGRWLHAAARQDQIFSKWHLMGYFHAMGTNGDADDEENRKKAYLWHLSWSSHFPPAPGESEGVVKMLRLSPSQADEVANRFENWRPSDEPPLRTEPCPGVDPWKNWRKWWNSPIPGG
jgi:hypothetical protein